MFMYIRLRVFEEAGKNAGFEAPRVGSPAIARDRKSSAAGTHKPICHVPARGWQRYYFRK